MAAASMLTPSSHYQPPSFAASTYPTQSSGPSPAPTMISSSEPRRQPDDNTSDAPARQSLPSISEVISGARPNQYAPHNSSMPPQPSAGGLTCPFAPTSRRYHDSDKHSHSPQPLHPASFPSTQNTISAFADSPPPPFSRRPGLPPVTGRRPTPPGKHDDPARDPVHHDYRFVSGGYAQPHAPTSHPYQPSHLPPGQMPLPVCPISPHPQPHGEPGPYAGRRYEQAPRHFENWTYAESLGGISTHSCTIFNFAEAYRPAAQEHQGGPSTIERLPSEREVNEMLANVDYIKRSLEQVRDIFQHTERAREGAKAEGAHEESHDVQ